jgi:hypothetical protein
MAGREPPQTIYVSRSYYNGRVLTKEEADVLEPLKVNHNPGPTQGHVKYGAGLTINLGNYESVRVDVGIMLPALPEEVEQAFEACVNFVDGKLSEQKSMLESIKTKE